MRMPGRPRTRHRPLLIGLLACALIASSGIAGADPADPSETPPATTTEVSPPSSTKPAPTTIKEVPPEKIPLSGDALIAAPGDAPPSAFEDANPPAREASPQRSGRDFSALNQQRSSGPQQSMTLDEIPALPAGITPRSETEPIPEGFTKEEADLSERMEYALNEGCQTYWPSPNAVCGEIRNKYNAMGGPASFLNFPKSPEYQNPGATGFRSEFVNGSLYWSPSTGAHPVTLLYMAKWAQHNWETGFMGYPTNDEIGNNDGQGSHQEFQGTGTYWHPLAGINNIGGAIRAQWNTVGAEAGQLGYPISDEIDAPSILEFSPFGSRMNIFQAGVLFYHSTNGVRQGAWYPDLQTDLEDDAVGSEVAENNSVRGSDIPIPFPHVPPVRYICPGDSDSANINNPAYRCEVGFKDSLGSLIAFRTGRIGTLNWDGAMTAGGFGILHAFDKHNISENAIAKVLGHAIKQPIKNRREYLASFKVDGEALVKVFAVTGEGVSLDSNDNEHVGLITAYCKMGSSAGMQECPDFVDLTLGAGF